MTTQTIVQVAPSTAIATAINYGPGSASATAVAAPTQIASQSANARADDPAMNIGSGHQTANNTTSNTTSQTIDQYTEANANATAISYNGHAVATAIAAPTQIASQKAATSVFGNGDNIGLGSGNCGLCGFGHQDVRNTATNTTSQSIDQDAPTTARATATSGGDLCGICDFGGNSGNATAIAIAKPVQIASQTANDIVRGTAINTSLGSGHQTAHNTTVNHTDQDIDQNTTSTATATATNTPFGFHNSQSATAVAVSQPSQIAAQGALNVVTGSASNSALGFGCDCLFFGGSHQTAINKTINHTDQDITQHGDATATATADNSAFGFGNHQTATAIAVAAPKQSASEYSAAYVSGIATNIGLGHGSDQFAFNLTVNKVPQTIRQNANSTATARADNDAFGIGYNQSAQATAIAAPSQTAGITARDLVKGQAINTDLGSSSCSLCDLFGGHTHQHATNKTINDVPQTITQRAPVTARANAFNNGFGFDLGLCEICDFGHFGNFNHNNTGSTQNATAVAASAPTQRAGEALAINAFGTAANVNLGNGSVHQHATNETKSDAEQHITQLAPSHVRATAVNNPTLVPTLTTTRNECVLFCDHFGSNSVRAQNATAIATAQPSQTASEAMSQALSGTATNIATGTSGNSCSHCGCDLFCGSFGSTHQHADNYVESAPLQRIRQEAPTHVEATAKNWPASDSIVLEVACHSSCGNHSHHGFNNGTQNATAIAAAQPVQSASETYSAALSGQALNTLVRDGNSCSHCDRFGHSSQYADNDVENYPWQRISQNARSHADADAENWAFGHGSQQQALAIAVAAPRQQASEAERDLVLGTASNISFGAGHQDADNYTYNGTCYLEFCGGYQTIRQYAPVHADADAYNYPSITAPWFSHHGFGGLQSATAIAAGAPLQIARQTANQRVIGLASNVNVGSQCSHCGHFGHGVDQDATNYTDNEVTQIIRQHAPTHVIADAVNYGQSFPWWWCHSGCSDEPQTATAIATSAASQKAYQNAVSGLTGNATNVNLSNSGCFFFCGHSHHNGQDADNTSLNTLDQHLSQQARARAEAHATNFPNWFDLGGIWGQGGDWNSCGTCGGLGLNTLAPLAGLNSNLGYNVPSFNAPIFSTPVTLSGLPIGLGNLGSTNIAFSGKDLGISLGLHIGNSESLKLPTISNLLHGVSLFGLLHGVVSLSLNLSVTTPWVQYAAAVAHQTPFSVLFSVSAQHSLAPWYGTLL